LDVLRSVTYCSPKPQNPTKLIINSESLIRIVMKYKGVGKGIH